jgi:hypothetical protein
MGGTSFGFSNTKVQSATLADLTAFLNRKDDVAPTDSWGNRVKVFHKGIDLYRELPSKETVKGWIAESKDEVDDLDMLWKAMVVDRAAKRQAKEEATGKKMGTFVCIADVSGSMANAEGSVPPMNVSISLAQFLSEFAPEPFRGKWMNFSTHPKWQSIDLSLNIRERIEGMDYRNWEQSTDLQKAMTLVLSKIDEFMDSPEYKDLSEEEKEKKLADLLPEALVIISDMQFNEACRGASSVTNFEAIRHRFTARGLNMPVVVFWNVSSTGTDTPVTAHETGTILISGFNPDIMDSLLDGDSTAFSPLKFILKILSASTFDRVSAVGVAEAPDDVGIEVLPMPEAAAGPKEGDVLSALPVPEPSESADPSATPQ